MLHDEHWALLMKNFLKSKEYRNLIDQGFPPHIAGALLAEKEKLGNIGIL